MEESLDTRDFGADGKIKMRLREIVLDRTEFKNENLIEMTVGHMACFCDDV